MATFRPPGRISGAAVLHCDVHLLQEQEYKLPRHGKGGGARVSRCYAAELGRALMSLSVLIICSRQDPEVDAARDRLKAVQMQNVALQQKQDERRAGKAQGAGLASQGAQYPG